MEKKLTDAWVKSMSDQRFAADSRLPDRPSRPGFGRTATFERFSLAK
jgi:hypothetical protein